MAVPGRGKAHNQKTVVATSKLGLNGRLDKVNPLLKVCPVCGAGRYYKCWTWQGLGEGRYIIDLVRPHTERSS